jgi:hypothetical protein
MIRAEIVAACEAIGKKHGATIELNPGSFNAQSIRFKVEVSAIGTDGALTSDARNFKLYASMYGLKPEDLNKTFTWGGNKFKLVGLSPRRPKYPFIAENEVGKRFKFGVEIAQLINPVTPKV